MRWCTDQKVIFTWPRRGNKNDGAHVAQKNWLRVRALFGYYGDDTAGELAKLNEICSLDALFTNYLLPRQKLLLEQRNGAKLTNREDKAMTDCPSRRADDRIREASRTENTRSSEGIGQNGQLNIVVSPAWLRRRPALGGPRGRLDWWQRVAEWWMCSRSYPPARNWAEPRRVTTQRGVSRSLLAVVLISGG